MCSFPVAGFSEGVCMHVQNTCIGFLAGAVAKNHPARAGDVDSIPVLGRSPGEENGNALWCSSLGNPMDRGAWQATVHGVP